MPRDLRDVLAGLVFVVFGLAFAGLATSYEVGTPVRMGPGYFPMVLGVLLGLLGGLIAVRGFLAPPDEPVGVVPWRAVTLIVGAVLVFALTIRGLGLVPTLLITSALSALASRRTGVRKVAVVSVGLTVVSLLVFVAALNVRVPLLGPWVGG